MADRTREGLNNQKRGVSVFMSDELATSATLDDTLANLPAGSVVTNAYVIQRS